MLRDGAWQEMPLRNVVPGDVFRLSAGDLVPADARLVESRDLSVQQSMLTGESLPADKAARRRADAATTGPDAPDLVFLGTSVVSGTGTAVAIATGAEDDVRRHRGAAAAAARRKPSSSTACGDSAC